MIKATKAAAPDLMVDSTGSLEEMRGCSSEVIDLAVRTMSNFYSNNLLDPMVPGSEEYDERIARIVQAVFYPDDTLVERAFEAGYGRGAEWLYVANLLLEESRRKGV